MMRGYSIRLVGLLALFCIVFCVFLIGSSRTLGVYDEGLILTGAFRVLHGELPSRDFYANYGPAQFFLLAGVLAAAGVDSLAARWLDAAQMAGIVLAAWLLLRPLAPRAWAAVGTMAVLLLLLTTRSELWPINPSILIVLCLVMVLQNRLVEGRGLTPCWPAAWLLAALLLTRYDLMPKVLLGVGIPTLAILALQRQARWLDGGEIGRILLANTAMLALVLGGTLAGLWAMGILGPAISDILTYNTGNYIAMRDLPFATWQVIARQPLQALVYLALPALVAATLALTRLAWELRWNVARDPRAVALLLLAGATVMLFTKGLVRTEPLHMVAANVPAVLLLAISGAVLAAPLVQLVPVLIRRGAALLALFAGLYMLQGVLASRGAADTAWRIARGPNPDLPGFRVFSAEPHRLAAARHVAAATAPDERILSATGRHDKIFVNDIAFNVLAGRLPGTRWHHYDPGVQNAEAVQRAMIADLERHRVQVVMRDRSFDEVREPNRSALSSGVTLLDDYLARAFAVEAVFGPITILRRQGAPSPG